MKGYKNGLLDIRAKRRAPHYLFGCHWLSAEADEVAGRALCKNHKQAGVSPVFARDALFKRL